MSLVILTVVLTMTGMPGLQERPREVYLFDCGGTIQRITAAEPRPEPAMRVAEIDSTLPPRVRDGCAIRYGAYDAHDDRLVLTVQTVAWQSADDDLPTRSLSLSFPDLTPAGGAAAAPVPRAPDWRTMRRALDTLDLPFAASIAYLLADGETVLLQEVENPPAQPRPRVVPYRTAPPGAVLRNGAVRDATGRYALLHVPTGALRGRVIQIAGVDLDHRVVCATPNGRLYLALTRNALLELDATDPARRATATDLAVDLYWTACAVRPPS